MRAVTLKKEKLPKVWKDNWGRIGFIMLKFIRSLKSASFEYKWKNVNVK